MGRIRETVGGLVIGLEVVGVDTEAAKQFVKGKLMNQWVVLDGDLNAIERIENSVYPPRTPKNKILR